MGNRNQIKGLWRMKLINKWISDIERGTVYLWKPFYHHSSILTGFCASFEKNLLIWAESGAVNKLSTPSSVWLYIFCEVEDIKQWGNHWRANKYTDAEKYFINLIRGGRPSWLIELKNSSSNTCFGLLWHSLLTVHDRNHWFFFPGEIKSKSLLFFLFISLSIFSKVCQCDHQYLLPEEENLSFFGSSLELKYILGCLIFFTKKCDWLISALEIAWLMRQDTVLPLCC